MKVIVLFILGCCILITSCTEEETFVNFSYPDGKYKSLIMSYDDGVVDDIRLISLFDKNDIIGTFNLNSGYLGMTRGWPMENGDTIFQSYLPKDSLIIVYKNHEIAAHGALHKNLTDITEDEVLEEIETDILKLKQITGREIISMAYPFGNTNENVARILQATGITNARTVGDTYTFELPENYFIWNPTCHDSKANDYIKDYIDLNEHSLSVFYVWGHSWEFKDQKRWNNIVRFCEQIGNQDDIWYVGSGQYIDYLKALDNIIISEQEIINPIGNDLVWVELSTGFKILEPGDKLKIKSKNY